MGSICVSARQVQPSQPRTPVIPRTRLILSAEGAKTVTLSKLPGSYADFLQQTAARFSVPSHFLVMKTSVLGKEFCIADALSYTKAISAGGDVAVTVFYPTRQALAHKSLEKTITVLVEGLTGTPQEKETWGLLRPVPIDVEVNSRSSQSYTSRDSSLVFLRSERDPRTAQCFQGHMLLFDAATEDSFKYFGASIDDGSRAVVLPNGNFVITGGKKAPSQCLKLDINSGSSKHSSSLNQSRHSHASIWSQGFVWAIGGFHEGKLPHCEVYEGEKWRTIAGLTVARSCPGASSWGKLMFAYGGIEEASIEKYDGESWVELTLELTQPLACCGIAQLDESVVIIAGGLSPNDMYEVTRLNLALGERESLASLPITDHFTGETVVYKEEIYFQGFLATYVYDPGAGTWRCIE